MCLVFFLTALLATAQDSASVWPYQTFKTTSFNPPRLQINKTGKALSHGLILFTPQGLTKESASALIMTDDGALVWNGPQTQTTNLAVQSLGNETVLTSWEGVGLSIGFGYGSVSILDTTYTKLYTICPKLNIVTSDGRVFDCYADCHESYMTDHGTMLVTVVNVTTADLSSVRGPRKGWVYDTMFMEIDIKTNETVFQWSPLAAGIPINSTREPLGLTGRSAADPFNWFHMNSVQQVGTSYLVNSRQTWSTYMIDSTGKVEWTIQGEHGGNFSLPPKGQFKWQHQARAENVTSTGMVLHYFNNFNSDSDYGTHPTEGLKLNLDLANRSVKVLKAFTDPTENIYSITQGAHSLLPNGNTLLSYGSIARIKEFGPTGDVRMRLQFGPDELVFSYRAYRQAWGATPYWAPEVAVEDGLGYVSWNGDTRTTRWMIYTGDANGTMSRRGLVERKGFETSFGLPNGTTALRVGAYAGNRFLRNSSVISVKL